MTRLWVDANVLVRFLTRDPEDLAERAARMMERADRGEVLLVLPSVVVAEVVWVLKSFYKYPLDAIAKALVPLLGADGVEVENRESLIQAIELARDKNVDFADALIAIEAARHGESVCSFDKDFRRLAVKQVVPD